MPKFIIERDIPKVGQMTGDQLKVASEKSNRALCDLEHSAQWLHSYLTDDKLYCIYIADDERAVLEHANKSGFPASRIEMVRTIIDPTTAE